MNKERTEYSLLHKLIRSWAVIAALVLLILYAAMEAGGLHFEKEWLNKTLYLIVEVSLHVALIFVLFELWFEMKTRESFLDYMGQKIAESLTLRDEVIKHLSVNFKIEAIKKLFLSIFLEDAGDQVLKDAGNQVYAGIIEPYLRHDLCCRKKFEYDMNLFDFNRIINEGWNREALRGYEDHVFIKEAVSFERSCFKKQEANDLGIGIALYDEALEEMFQKGSLIFREVIEMDEAMQRKMADIIGAVMGGADKGELLKFVTDVLKLEVYVGEEDRALSEPRIEVSKEPKGMKGFHVLFPLKREYREGGIRVKMAVPQKASSNKFRASVAELTNGGRISFTNHIEGKSLSSVSYLTSSKGVVEVNRDHRNQHTYNFYGQWVYPNSGVVFVWQDKNNEKKLYN